VDHMRRIAANANPSLTEVWVVPGADHGHAHALTGRHYEARVRQFFDRSLCGRPAPISGHRTFFRAQRTNDQPGECQAVLRRAGFGAVVSDSSGRDTSSVVPEVLQTEILSDGGGRSFGGAIIEVSDRATRASIIRTLDERDGFWQRFRVSRLEGLDEEVAQRQINLSINSEVNYGDPFKAWNKKRVGCEPKEGLNRRAPGGREFDLRWSTADNRAPRENCQASLRTLRAERPRNRWSRA